MIKNEYSRRHRCTGEEKEGLNSGILATPQCQDISFFEILIRKCRIPFNFGKEGKVKHGNNAPLANAQILHSFTNTGQSSLQTPPLRSKTFKGKEMRIYKDTVKKQKKKRPLLIRSAAADNYKHNDTFRPSRISLAMKRAMVPLKGITAWSYRLHILK